MNIVSVGSKISPAQAEFFSEGLKRTGLNEFIDSRLQPELASLYIADQFGAWQTRKTVNDEAHQDAVLKFTSLDPRIQHSVARLAELRLAATAAIFSPSGLQALIEFGKTVTPEQVPDLRKFLDEAAAGNKKLLIPALEKHMSISCHLGSTADFTYTEILLRIHHATWHANLDKPHDFAFKEDNLPKDSSTGPVTGKEYLPNLRVYSDKADTLNVLTQLGALARTFAKTGPMSIYDMDQSGRIGVVEKTNPLLNAGWQSILANLDAGAVINN